MENSINETIRVAIYGSGNLGHAFAQAIIHTKGLKLHSIIARNEISGNNLAQKFKTPYFTSLPENDAPDFLILCVPDASIASICKALPSLPHTIVCHCSGATDVNILSENLKYYGVIYPVQSFNIFNDVDFSTIPILIEANNPHVLIKIKKLSELLSNHVIEVSSSSRIMYHIAAVYANNFVNHLWAMSKELCEKENLDFEILRPLIESTFQKIRNESPTRTQTGPAVRKDWVTIHNHYDLLEKHPKHLEIYKLLTESIISFYTQEK
jgi:predicted short-subunit dehydrogenase-like oxidoreductase (DUF2520 family)